MLCKHAGVRRSGDNSCNWFPSLCPRESHLGSQAWQQVPDLLSPAVRPPCSAAVTAVLSAILDSSELAGILLLLGATKLSEAKPEVSKES